MLKSKNDKIKIYASFLEAVYVNDNYTGAKVVVYKMNIEEFKKT